MLEGGATHVGVATDHVVESFRNDLYDGYKTSAGMDPVLLAQFPVLEDALRALGVAVWADGRGRGRRRARRARPRSARPTSGSSRSSSARPTRTSASAWSATGSSSSTGAAPTVRDEAGVIAKFGVPPESIPD